MNEKYTALTREGVIIIIACCVFILDNQCVLYLCMAFLSRTRNLAHELELAHVVKCHHITGCLQTKLLIFKN